MGLTFGTLVVVNHRAMKRARLDVANREFFDQFLPATLRDFVPQIIVVVALLVAGSWIGFSGEQGWFAVLVLVGIFIGLGYETHNAAKYWRVSMGQE